MTILSLEGFLLDHLADPRTDTRLLPCALVSSDNSRRRQHCLRAVHLAMDKLLSSIQKEQLRMFFCDQLRKSEIAAFQNRTCSSVSKSIHASLAILRDYATLYMEIYDELEQDMLREWEA